MVVKGASEKMKKSSLGVQSIREEIEILSR